jgi:hypothetical protein
MEVMIALREEAIATLNDYSFDAEEAAFVRIEMPFAWAFGSMG